MSANNTQDARILAHMRKRGSITPAQAFAFYRCLALHSAIARLRREGYRIECRMQAQGRVRWGRYSLG